MDKTSLYVKKIFIFLLVSFAALYAYKEYSNLLFYIILPVSFLSIALLHHGFAGIKPPYLFTLDKSDEFINKKNGFWMFFKPLLLLVGFIHDIVVWCIWGVYLVYVFILDIIQLNKTILYWMFHALLWFLKLYVPAIKLLYKWFIYYVIKWPWWLYKLCFVNINNAYKRNNYFLAAWGTVIAFGVIFLFYYLSIVTGVFGLTAVGFILAMLPLSWSYGEIASVKKAEMVQKPYWEIKKHFNNGMEAVRNVLVYLLIFLVLAILQIVLDMVGWIPKAGYSFLGFVFDINMLISFLLIILTFILSFASAILPTNLLFGGKSQPNFTEILSQLSVIFKRCLRTTFVGIPASIFGVIVLFLPVLMFLLTLNLTTKVKDNVLQAKIEVLSNRKNDISNKTANYLLEKEIEKLQMYKAYPILKFGELIAKDKLNNNVRKLQNRLGVLTKNRENYSLSWNNLSLQIDQARQMMDGPEKNRMLDKLTREQESLQPKLAHTNTDMQNTITDIDYAKNYRAQTYIVFFFAGLGLSIFGGLAFAFFISFMGNVYYDLFHFNEDGKPVYLMQTVFEENETDKRQPLIGFTLLIITILLFLYGSTCPAMYDSLCHIF